MGHRRAAGRALMLIAAVAVWGCAANPNNDSARLHVEAQADLANWDKVVAANGGSLGFIATSDTTLMAGYDWGPNIDGGAAKIALMSGYFEAAITLPDDAPPDGQVSWQDGTTRTAAVLSAVEAFEQMKAGASSCPDCTIPLTITAATLTMATFDTSRGKAVAPAWEFTLQDTPVRVDQLAVRDRVASVPEPSIDPNNPPVGIRIDSAAVDSSGMTLTVRFVGAKPDASTPCGADYTAEAIESDNAAVVIVYEHRNQLPAACTDEGYFRTAQATLARPLGSRAVLEVQTGQPVPVTNS